MAINTSQQDDPSPEDEDIDVPEEVESALGHLFELLVDKVKAFLS